MTPPPAQPMENNDALFDLVDRYIYETLSDEEFKRLEKALQSHRPLRDYYRQSARLDAGLGTLAASLEQGAGAPLGPVQTQASRRHWIAAIAAIAILTLICSALLVERWHRSPSQSPVSF